MISQHELLLKGAQVRLQELTQEIRDLLHHFPSLPKSLTIAVTPSAVLPKAEEKKQKKEKLSGTAAKRNKTLMDRWGTLNVGDIKRMRAGGTKPFQWRDTLVKANSGSEAVNH